MAVRSEAHTLQTPVMQRAGSLTRDRPGKFAPFVLAEVLFKPSRATGLNINAYAMKAKSLDSRLRGNDDIES